MDDKKWLDIALKMEPHLKELSRIAKQSGLDSVAMYASVSGTWWATYVESDETAYEVKSINGGATQVQKGFDTYYTKV